MNFFGEIFEHQMNGAIACLSEIKHRGVSKICVSKNGRELLCPNHLLSTKPRGYLANMYNLIMVSVR